MELKLTTWQRASLLMIIGQVKGNVAVLRQSLRILEAMDFSEDERKEIEYQERPDGTAAWKADACQREWTVSLDEKDIRFIVFYVETFDGWPVANARDVLNLLQQLEAVLSC